MADGDRGFVFANARISKNMIPRRKSMSKKCANCGLMNFEEVTQCRRCAEPLREDEWQEVDLAPESGSGRQNKTLQIGVAAVLIVASIFFLPKLYSHFFSNSSASTNAKNAAGEGADAINAESLMGRYTDTTFDSSYKASFTETLIVESGQKARYLLDIEQRGAEFEIQFANSSTPNRVYDKSGPFTIQGDRILMNADFDGTFPKVESSSGGDRITAHMGDADMSLGSEAIAQMALLSDEFKSGKYNFSSPFVITVMGDGLLELPNGHVLSKDSASQKSEAADRTIGRKAFPR
jgi:hypothetical protein